MVLSHYSSCVECLELEGEEMRGGKGVYEEKGY